jgi:23S rRNA (cytosine1962-C5)-methyltransferase
LLIEAIEKVALDGVIDQEKANQLVLKYRAKIKDHKDYIMAVGDDPEEILNWQWVRELISKQKKPIRVLNLFGYTGGASIACAQGGAQVVHIDASKTAITQAVRNADLSSVPADSIRFIPEDVRRFVDREIRRASTYDAIIMDPPAFGHGIKKELWKIEQDLMPLIEQTKRLLVEQPLFYILNGYASGYSSIAYKQNIEWLIERYGGHIEYGELAIQQKDSEHLLPAGITARWNSIC